MYCTRPRWFAVALQFGQWDHRSIMNTPVRPVRIDQDLWRKAELIAQEYARTTDLSVTASDIVRKALKEFVSRNETMLNAAIEREAADKAAAQAVSKRST